MTGDRARGRPAKVEGRSLLCKAKGCGGRLVVDTRAGITVEHCPACEKREQAFLYGVRRPSIPCTVCGCATKQNTRGRLLTLCPACRDAKARHEKVVAQMPTKPKGVAA